MAKDVALQQPRCNAVATSWRSNNIGKTGSGIGNMARVTAWRHQRLARDAKRGVSKAYMWASSALALISMAAGIAIGGDSIAGASA